MFIQKRFGIWTILFIHDLNHHTRDDSVYMGRGRILLWYMQSDQWSLLKSVLTLLKIGCKLENFMKILQPKLFVWLITLWDPMVWNQVNLLWSPYMFTLYQLHFCMIFSNLIFSFLSIVEKFVNQKTGILENPFSCKFLLFG